MFAAGVRARDDRRCGVHVSVRRVYHVDVSSTSGPRRRWLRLGLACIALAIGVGLVALWRSPIASFAAAGRATLRIRGFAQRHVPASGGTVAYYAAGRGPLVLLLHGVNAQAGAWARVAPALTARHRVVAMDLPGHADSGPRTGPLTIADMVDGVRAVADAERGAGPVVLVGNSLGGFLAVIHALRHPDEVSAVVAVNGALMRGGNEAAAKLLIPKTLDEARVVASYLVSPASPATPDFILADLVRRAPTSPLARLEGTPVDPWIVDDRLGELRMPVTLIWGADDRLIPVSYAEAAKRRIPHASLTTLSACGHIPQVECPDALLPPLTAAIDAVSAR